MKNFVIRLFVNALALTFAAWLLDGIEMSGGFFDVLLVALVFGLLNAILKPILLFFSIPLLILTLGLFALVVNAVMLMVTARLLDDFAVSGFWSALLGSVVISIVTMLLGSALKDGDSRRSGW
jgi:putative membrane protein